MYASWTGLAVSFLPLSYTMFTKISLPCDAHRLTAVAFPPTYFRYFSLTLTNNKKNLRSQRILAGQRYLKKINFRFYFIPLRIKHLKIN